MKFIIIVIILLFIIELLIFCRAAYKQNRPPKISCDRKIGNYLDTPTPTSDEHRKSSNDSDEKGDPIILSDDEEEEESAPSSIGSNSMNITSIMVFLTIIFLVRLIS